jgi:hypothetical protein
MAPRLLTAPRPPRMVLPLAAPPTQTRAIHRRLEANMDHLLPIQAPMTTRTAPLPIPPHRIIAPPPQPMPHLPHLLLHLPHRLQTAKGHLIHNQPFTPPLPPAGVALTKLSTPMVLAQVMAKEAHVPVLVSTSDREILETFQSHWTAALRQTKEQN